MQSASNADLNELPEGTDTNGAGKSMWPAYAIALCSILIGLIYVIIIRPGTPYDELAHFQNCRYYATHWSMPVMGTPGTNYQTYHGPGYYILGALLYNATAWAGETAALYTMRVADLLLMVPLTILSYRIARRFWPKCASAGLLVALFVGLNPCLIGIAASVQNDILTLTLCTWGLVLLDRYVNAGTFEVRSAVGIGVLLGLAILVKATAAVIVIPMAVWMVVANRSRGLWAALAFCATIGVITGWWFVRNERLYGDSTGIASIMKYHPEATCDPAPLMEPRYQFLVLEEIVAHYWFPMEYYRNVIPTPKILTVAVVLLSGLALVGAVSLVIGAPDADPRARSFARFLAAAYLIALVLYLRTISTTNWYPPRALYPIFILFALGLANGLLLLGRSFKSMPRNGAAGALLVLLLASNAFVIVRAMRLPVMGYNENWTKPLPFGPAGERKHVPRAAALPSPFAQPPYKVQIRIASIRHGT